MYNALLVLLAFLYTGLILCTAVTTWQASEGLNLPGSLYAACFGVFAAVFIPELLLINLVTLEKHG